MKSRHDGADRNVEDLRGLRVAELADVDKYEHVAEVMRHRREGLGDVVLRQPLENSLLVALVGRVETVVEEVVALLERLGVRCPLRAAAAVYVQVREDAQEPRAEVRPGSERLPTPKGTCIRLLHQVLGLFLAARDPTGHSVHLVCKRKRFLLEMDTISRASCDSPGLL